MYYTPYWNNIKSYWEQRNNPNICFLTYEDMKRDLPSVIRKTSTFLNKQLSEEKVSKLTEHLSFNNMKNNNNANYDGFMTFIKMIFGTKGDFIRKGQIGDHKNEMCPEVEKKFDKWIEENIKDMRPMFSHDVSTSVST